MPDAASPHGEYPSLREMLEAVRHHVECLHTDEDENAVDFYRVERATALLMSAIPLCDRRDDALRQYADPRNWGISRDDLNHRVVSWIGPGAEKSGMPDAMRIAREALDA